MAASRTHQPDGLIFADQEHFVETLNLGYRWHRQASNNEDDP